MYASEWDTDIASLKRSLDQQVGLSKELSKECQNWPPKESPMRHRHRHLDDITILIGRSLKGTFIEPPKGPPYHAESHRNCQPEKITWQTTRTPKGYFKGMPKLTSEGIPNETRSSWWNHLTNRWDSQRNFQRNSQMNFQKGPSKESPIRRGHCQFSWWDLLTNRWRMSQIVHSPRQFFSQL